MSGLNAIDVAVSLGQGHAGATACPCPKRTANPGAARGKSLALCPGSGAGRRGVVGRGGWAEEAAERGWGVVEVFADGAGEVGLVGEAEVGGQGGEAGFALGEAVHGVADTDAVAVAGERYAHLLGEGPAQPVRGDLEVSGQ